MALLSRRSLLAGPLALGALPARAQNLPERGIRIVTGFPVGGGTDDIARVIAAALQRRLARPVTVEPRPGAAGIGVGEALKKAPTDGSVLAMIPSATLVGRLTTPSFPFDPATDIVPLTMVGTYSTAFAVSPRIDVASLAEYRTWLATAGPGESRFGTASLQSLTHFFGLMVGHALDHKLEAVVYKGASPMVRDLVEGKIPAAASGLTSLLQHHRSRRVRILMTSGARRSRVASDIPTVAELGYPGLELVSWYAFFAPRGLPPAVSASWERELRDTLETKDVTDQLTQLGLEVETTSGEEFAARLAADMTHWRTLLDTIDVKTAN